MAEFLIDNLRQKTVMNANGQELGTLQEVTFSDKRSGELQNLVVSENPEINPDLATEYPRDKYGNLLVPTTQVTSVEDYILIS